MRSDGDPVRLGCDDYANAQPFHGLLEGTPYPLELTWAPPATLNQLLATNKIDAGFISVGSYLKTPTRYQSIGQLGVAARKAVRSVLLISDRPFAALKGRPIGVTSESETSVLLLRVLLAKLAGDDPRRPFVGLGEGDADLLIGDAALQRAARHDEAVHIFDLAELWVRETCVPMVFGAWFARRDWAEEHEEELADLATRLRDSVAAFRGNPLPLVRAQAARLQLPAERLGAYYDGLTFVLGDSELAGISRFAEELDRLGIQSPAA